MSNQTLATLSAHPTDNRTLLLRTPPGLADQMGRFEPARYDAAHRAYLLHVDHVEALHRFAAAIRLHVVDERTRPPGERTLMPECAACGQPARATRQPARCPACGEPWIARYVNPGTGHGEHVRQTCGDCGHTQRGGRFPYCGSCGAAMPPDLPKPHVEIPRQRLKDPASLAETVPETVAEIEARQTEEAP